MTHYAKILNKKVQKVIVAEQDFFNTFVDDSPGQWIETSYNTRGGVHKTGGTPLRKNFAGIGYTYDEDRDAFIPPKPFNSWTLNETTCLWEAPVPEPELTQEQIDNGNYYVWNETNQIWDLTTKE